MKVTMTPLKRKTINNQNRQPGSTQGAHGTKELSPFGDCLTIHRTNTPMKLQLEYLQSPLPAAKDLFSQLLGSDSKMCSPMSPVQMDFAECISANYCEEDMIKESEQEESDIEDNSEESESRQDCDDIKKRKRKSTAQIKMLKQQLNGEMNWSKEKIVKMAEVTGLSQSQVYKWCWDQKKKTSKYFRERDDELAHRKLIRKDYRERQPGQEEDMKWRHVETKVKPRGDLDTEVESTSKKINKKLLF